MSPGFSTVVVGATGAVGRTFLTVFAEKLFQTGELRLLASSRSVGNRIEFLGNQLIVEEASPKAFEGARFVFMSAGAARSREFAPAALEAGAVVIDNSSAFRMDPEVPLVVPEINAVAIKPGDRLIANPNCTAIVALMAVAPLRRLGTLERLVMSSYQSASGGGAALMEDLERQTREVLSGHAPLPKVSPHPYAFNLFSHNTPVGPDGYNEEERKVIEESRKILSMPELGVNVTCVRVPVLRAHSVSITAEFAGEAPSEADVREELARSPGVRVVDDRAGNHFPMPSEASGQGDVLVGRIRRDLSNPRAICLFASGDQLLKGAALNAVQIAEAMLARGLVPGVPTIV